MNILVNYEAIHYVMVQSPATATLTGQNILLSSLLSNVFTWSVTTRKRMGKHL
jgi:hypothetical protein